MQNTKRKRKAQGMKPGHRLTVLFLTMIICCLTGCTSDKITTTVTLDGKTIPIQGTLQTCIDNGLITTDTSGNEQQLTTQYAAKEVRYESVRLGNGSYPHKSPVSVACYNPENKSNSVYDCSIMTVYYYTEYDNADLAPVLIDGIDFWGMTEDEALEALKEHGLKVDADKMHQSHYIVFSEGKVVWTIESKTGNWFDDASEEPQKKNVEFDPDTYYISKVEVNISSSLNIKFNK